MNTSHVLTIDEAKKVSNLKHEGFLRPISIKPGNRIFINCADGDYDARRFHRKISVRHHPKSDFGGPLLLARIGFRGYTGEDARSLLKNISWGMEAKDTKDISCLMHWPCGVGQKFGHTMEDIFLMVPEILDMLSVNEYFEAGEIAPLFHVRRINRAGNLEENMYQMYLPDYHRHFGGRPLLFE